MRSLRGNWGAPIGEAAEPVPADDEVLIDVHAASVSYMDYLMASGGYQLRPPLPYVPGTDAAGVVIAVGDKVARFRPGDRVACGNWFGGFAERMVAKASKSARLPDTVDFFAGSTVTPISRHGTPSSTARAWSPARPCSSLEPWAASASHASKWRASLAGG